MIIWTTSKPNFDYLIQFKMSICVFKKTNEQKKMLL
jgi:hypothetical protein